jgi:hypothetical protein
MKIPIHTMLLAASRIGGVSMSRLRSSGRSTKYMVELRRAIIDLGRQHGYSFPRIGRALRRDHSTVHFHKKLIARMPESALRKHRELVAKIEHEAMASGASCACGAAIELRQIMCAACHEVGQEDLAVPTPRPNKRRSASKPYVPPPVDLDRTEVGTTLWWRNNDMRFRMAIQAAMSNPTWKGC